jgi:hypothetical protein
MSKDFEGPVSRVIRRKSSYVAEHRHLALETSSEMFFIEVFSSKCSFDLKL